MANQDRIRKIGLLDSGLGGLTTYQEIKKYLPLENILYFGDTLHAPYGEKEDYQILEYVFQIIDFFIQKRVKLVIIACNTATAVALDLAKSRYNIPIFGVIQPGAEWAVKATKNHRIGIIGTEVTIRNQIYEKIIGEINPSMQTYSKECSNQIIRILEQGLYNGKKNQIQKLFHQCLNPILKNDIDTLIMGCTHYPLLVETIRKKVGPDIKLIDPSVATTRQIQEWIQERSLSNNDKKERDSFYVSGDVKLFSRRAEQLLGYMPGEFFQAKL